MARLPNFEVTIQADKIPDFGTSDDRIREQGWEIALVGSVNRDSALVDRCNHRAIVAELERVDPDQTGWGIMHCSHWAVGWIDHLLVDPTREDLIVLLGECMSALADYPILSDDLHSQMECEEHAAGRCEDGCSQCEWDAQEHAAGRCEDHCKRCEELREQIASEIESLDRDPPFAWSSEEMQDGPDGRPMLEIRLQLRWRGRSDDWAIHTGDPSYDQDHRGEWGSTFVPFLGDPDGDTIDATEIARELLAEAMEMRAQ